MFDRIVKCNLLDDDKELFYLTEFLGIKIDPNLYKKMFSPELEAHVEAGRTKHCADRKKLWPRGKGGKKHRRGSDPGMPKPKKVEPAEPGMEEEPIPEEPKASKIINELLEQADNAKKESSDEAEGGKAACDETVDCGDKESLNFYLDKFNRSLEFNLVSLPDNFDACYYTHMYKSCDLCKKRQAKNSLALCLMCGSLMCISACSSMEKKDATGGNLFKHSLSNHSGMCVFLDTYTGSHIIYEVQRLYQISGLYVNSFGLAVSDSKQRGTDFKTYKLDLSQVDKIKKDLLSMAIAERIVNLNFSSNSVYKRAIL